MWTQRKNIGEHFGTTVSGRKTSMKTGSPEERFQKKRGERRERQRRKKARLRGPEQAHQERVS